MKRTKRGARVVSRHRQHQEKFYSLAGKYLLTYARKFYYDESEAVSSVNLLTARLPDIAKWYNPKKRPPLAFLKGILKNGFLDYYRKHKRRKVHREAMMHQPGAGSAVFEDSLGASLEHELPDRLLTVARMSLLDRLPVAAVKLATGLSASEIRRQLTEIRRSLLLNN